MKVDLNNLDLSLPIFNREPDEDVWFITTLCGAVIETLIGTEESVEAQAKSRYRSYKIQRVSEPL